MNPNFLDAFIAWNAENSSNSFDVANREFRLPGFLDILLIHPVIFNPIAASLVTLAMTKSCQGTSQPCQSIPSRAGGRQARLQDLVEGWRVHLQRSLFNWHNTASFLKLNKNGLGRWWKEKSALSLPSSITRRAWPSPVKAPGLGPGFSPVYLPL